MQEKNNNRMRELRIEKVTLNIGTGKNPEKLDKAMILLERITNSKPIKTITNKRIPSWNLRPGIPVGCIVTVRKKNAEILLKRLLEAVDNTLSRKQIGNGTFSFGIKEYIDIEGMKYDPEIKVMGLEASVTLERRGFRIKRRRLKQKKIGKKHLITKEETIKFLQEKYNTKIRED
ncbi:MAG: 50S ribosomal protein L5 [Candidatus Woesearchaeota archaeon]